jgi:hypothetical protein
MMHYDNYSVALRGRLQAANLPSNYVSGSVSSTSCET